MNTVYLVEISGVVVRACASKDLADRYVQTLLEEFDEESEEARYYEEEIDIYPIPLDEK